jgi:hypothetical protein
MRLIITFCFLISSFSFCNAQMTGVTIEVDTAFFGPNTPTPDDTFDPLGTLDGFVTYKVYAHFTNSTDVLSAIYALNDAFDVTIPLEIDAPCGCHNPVETSITMDANNSSLFWDSFPLMQYDTYWTIGMTSGDDFGMNPLNIGMPDGSEICSSSTIDGALYVLSPAPNAIAGSDLRILIAQVTTCGDLCIGANFQVFINGDQNQIQYFQPTSQTCVEASIVGCTSETACNFNPYAIEDNGLCAENDVCGVCGGNGSSCLGCIDPNACNYNPGATIDDGSCDFTCCPGPGCCNDGTIWDVESQTCIVSYPSDSNFDGCVDLEDLMVLLQNYGLCLEPE